MQTSHFLIGEGKDQGKRPCHRGIPQLELKAYFRPLDNLSNQQQMNIIYSTCKQAKRKNNKEKKNKNKLQLE